jgi:inorganic pyrophosphatase
MISKKQAIKIAKDFLGKIVTIKIDRLINSKHPKYGFVYEVNYGFVPNTKAPDGEEIDAYLLGVNKSVDEFTVECIALGFNALRHRF